MMGMTAATLQAMANRPSATSCVPKTNDYCHIVNAAHDMLASPSFHEALNDVPDNETLNLVSDARFTTVGSIYAPQSFKPTT